MKCHHISKTARTVALPKTEKIKLANCAEKDFNKL